MSGRYRTVALQAVGVAVLAAFVFVAFLRPTEPGDLSGIDAPGGDDGPTVVKTPPDDKKGGKNKGDKKDGNSQSRSKRNDRSNGPRSNGNGKRGGGPSKAPDDDVTPPDDSGGPDDDQYTDLVSLLMKSVGAPELYKEIDDP